MNGDSPLVSGLETMDPNAMGNALVGAQQPSAIQQLIRRLMLMKLQNQQQGQDDEPRQFTPRPPQDHQRHRASEHRERE